MPNLTMTFLYMEREHVGKDVTCVPDYLGRALGCKVAFSSRRPGQWLVQTCVFLVVSDSACEENRHFNAISLFCSDCNRGYSLQGF